LEELLLEELEELEELVLEELVPLSLME